MKFYKDKLLVAKEELLKYDYIYFGVNKNNYCNIEEIEELKDLCINYFINNYINLEGLSDNQVEKISVGDRSRIIPKYMSNYEFFYTIPKKSDVVKEVITKKKIRTDKLNWELDNVKKNLTIIEYNFSSIFTENDYNELRNYLFNKDVIRGLFDLINNYQLNKYNIYRRIDEEEINKSNQIEKEIKRLLKRI